MSNFFKSVGKSYFVVVGVWLFLTIAMDAPVTWLTVLAGVLAIAYLIIVGVKCRG